MGSPVVATGDSGPSCVWLALAMSDHVRTDEPTHNDRISPVQYAKGMLVLLVIVGGSCLSYFKQTNLFPFDTYSMYSYLHTEDFQYPRMYGLPRNAGNSAEENNSATSSGAAEIDISDQKYWGFQMHIGRKVIATTRLLNRSDAGPEDVKTAMLFLRELYNRRQQDGLHDGPPIKQLRMYKYSWKLRSDLSTFDAPYQRTLMAESPISEER